MGDPGRTGSPKQTRLRQNHPLMTPGSLFFNIADLCISVSCRDRNVLVPNDPHYQPFYNDTKADDAHVDTEVRITVGDMPATSRMKRVFDSEGSWSLYADGKGGYVLTLSNVGASGPSCAAAFNGSAKVIDVYVDGSFLSGGGGEGGAVMSPLTYPLDRLLMMYILAARGGALFHAAGVSIEGRGRIFPGLSGAGKTTLSGVLASEAGFEVLSDERVAIRELDGEFFLYGTPWPGEAGVAENRRVPLKALYFIRHGGDNLITPLQTREAIRRLLPLAYVPWYDPSALPRVTDVIEALATHVPAYEFGFTPDARAADALRAHAAS